MTHLDDALQELKKREPISHQAELCSTREALERYTAPDFWEVGASGQVYSRSFSIDTVGERFIKNTEPNTSGWETNEFACRALGTDTYMLTYLLKQGARITRRLSIWRRAGGAWQIAYHQGTIVLENTQK